MGNVFFGGGKVGMIMPVGFPDEPLSYKLLETITESKTFIAPETGYYKIENFGASGNGGNALISNVSHERDGETYWQNVGGGSGGGGGAYASSIVKLKKDDLVFIEIGAVGADTIVTVNSTTNEVYEPLKVTSGQNGKSPIYPATPTAVIEGGAGGVATGGNLANNDGESGGNSDGYANCLEYSLIEGGTGGTSGHPSGNVGGNGATIIVGVGSGPSVAAGSGKAGFVRIFGGINVPSRLPAGYTELAYIQCSGFQYVNTEYSPQSENVEYECSWEEPTLGTTCTLFGSTNRNSSTNKWAGTHYKPAANSMYSATGATDAVAKIANLSAGVKNTLHTTISNGTITREQNGTTSTGTYSGSIQNGVNIGILANITNTDVIEICSNVKLCYWRMKDNGVLVRDYVPCISDTEGVGLYDLVDSKFYGNAGTGSFIAGEEVL